MLSKESGIQDFGLAEEVLNVLPADPFEQLDVARKITSIALSTRISAVQAEAADLRAQLSEKDQVISQLRSEVDTYGSIISNLESQLNSSSEANVEKEKLLKENAALQNTVRKLNRDVAKLEVFKKTLMQSLQEDDESSAGGGAPQIVAKLSSNSTLSSPISQTGGAHFPSEDEVTLPPSRYSSVQSRVTDMENSAIEDQESEASRRRISRGLLLTSQNTTPRFTPPGSPPRLSPTSSMPVSPRRQSMSFSTSRGLEDRSSVYSSMSSSRHGSVSSTDSDVAGRTRVDGKEFFRQVRSRLSYEQFGAFLANVKELNAHKQTREETLRKADEIFGTENKDLYVVFESLITRNTAH